MWEPDSSIELCLKLWEDKPCQKFKVPRNGLARINVWVHELSELGVKGWFQLLQSKREMWIEDEYVVDMPLNTIYMTRLISIKLPDGEIQTHRIDHVLTSLVKDSTLKIGENSFRSIQPDEYEKLIEGIPIIDISSEDASIS